MQIRTADYIMHRKMHDIMLPSNLYAKCIKHTSETCTNETVMRTPLLKLTHPATRRGGMKNTSVGKNQLNVFLCLQGMTFSVSIICPVGRAAETLQQY